MGKRIDKILDMLRPTRPAPVGEKNAAVVDCDVDELDDGRYYCGPHGSNSETKKGPCIFAIDKRKGNRPPISTVRRTPRHEVG